MSGKIIPRTAEQREWMYRGFNQGFNAGVRTACRWDDHQRRLAMSGGDASAIEAAAAGESAVGNSRDAQSEAVNDQ